MNEATRPWAPLSPPSGGGVPETFLGGLKGRGRPGVDKNYPIETMTNVAFLKSFPLKKENEIDEKIGFVTEQRGTRRQASD